MAKKEVTVKSTTVKVSEPKIHLEKYLNTYDYNIYQKNILNTLFRNEMHTATEWKKIAEREFSRDLS